ncbi:ATP-binding cassette domain-containing protein [Prochlorococcus marinus]|uniref:ATP-binding cassette domain-containing protein n=1 Tax=Prochlorococcus marinus TaxID=1219 RepID=UPI0022B52D3B|nr:ATP-binding cassette domain-containing protein [Prochlorococcus marinus]
MELDEKQLLIGLYLAYFGRPLRYYEEVIYFHLKGDQIISEAFSTFISNLSEFHHTYSASKPIEHQINDLYNNLFCRDVDNDGLMYWSNTLKSSSKGIESLANNLIYDTYQLTILNNNQAIIDYRTLLNKIEVCNCLIDIIRNNNKYNSLYNPISYEPWISGYFIDEIKSFIRKVDSKYQLSINALDNFIQNSFYKIHNQFLSPAIIINNISLDIPILGSESRNIKRSIINSVTGGALSKKKGLMTVKALSNLNLVINKGERVALIGHNGSGKSCLLRLISGIYKPSSGSIDIEVEVYPMIQKSFLTSDELTGVDAAKAFYLMSSNRKKDYQEYLDDIIEFSGLGSYIYLPIKTYSDGMSARLLFSILTSCKHDFLVIDEGFGTGDTDFYEKAEKRMKSFIEETGTLILASHSEELLTKFCDRGIVLSKGSLVFDGPLSHSLSFYHHDLNDLV